MHVATILQTSKGICMVKQNVLKKRRIYYETSILQYTCTNCTITVSVTSKLGFHINSLTKLFFYSKYLNTVHFSISSYSYSIKNNSANIFINIFLANLIIETFYEKNPSSRTITNSQHENFFNDFLLFATEI